MPPKKIPSKTTARAPAATKPKGSSTASKTATVKPTAAKKEPGKSPAAEAKPQPIEEVSIKALVGLLFGEDDNQIKQSGKWPLVIDTVGQVSTFLRHRDTNYMEAMDANKMAPESIRLGLLGACRYGKPLVLDMLDVDMFDACAKLFDNVQPGLMDVIMDKTIITDEKYIQLIKESDKPEYDEYNFNLKDNFQFVIVTTHPAPPPSLLQKMYPIKVV